MKHLRQPLGKWAPVYFCFATAWAGLTNGWASTYRPIIEAISSNTVRASEVSPNSSFLANTKQTQFYGPNMQSEILGTHRYLVIRQQLEDMTRAYEMKKKFGLADLEDERAYQDQLRGMSGHVINQIRDHQQDVRGNKIVGNVVRQVTQDKAAMTLLKPVILAGAVVGVCTGTPIELPVMNLAKIRTRTDLRSQEGNFEVQSQLFSGRFDFSARAPETQDFSKPAGADGERFRLSVFRQLPIVDVATGVAYNSSSRTVNASMTKQVSPQVSLAVGAVQAVEGTTRGEQTLSVNYGLRF